MFDHLATPPSHVTTEEVREWDYGEYEGLKPAEIKERNPNWSIWKDGWVHLDHYRMSFAHGTTGAQEARARKRCVTEWIVSLRRWARLLKHFALNFEIQFGAVR